MGGGGTHLWVNVGWFLLSCVSGSGKLPSSSRTQAHSNATFSLLLPGKVLNLHVLTTLRKYKGRGNKAGAIEAWKLLHESGIGRLIETKARRGTDKVSANAAIQLPPSSNVVV